MAVVAVIFGGMAGFLSAVTALILFNASWLLALGLWGLGGLAVAVTLLVLSRGFRQPEPELVAAHA
jgi:hypothetical protein